MTISGMTWTGRLEFDLTGRGGCPVATVEVAVRRDVVLCWISQRTIAAIDRDRMHGWLQHPSQPLAIDDVVWSMLGSDLALSVDGSIPYVLADDLTRQLVTVV